MATYDLNHTELSSALADVGVSPQLRAEIIATLEDANAFHSPQGNHGGHDNDHDYGHGHDHDDHGHHGKPGDDDHDRDDHGHSSQGPEVVTTSIVHDGETASPRADAVIYTDDVSGYVEVPKEANAVVFATDDGVIAEIGGSGPKIVVSGDGNDI